MALELGACSILELTQLRLHFSNIRDNCSSVAKNKKQKKRRKLDIVASKIVLLKEHMIYCKKKLDRAGERPPPRHYN